MTTRRRLSTAKRWLAVAIFAFLSTEAVVLAKAPPVQSAVTRTQKLETGKDIYYAGCASCHGPDGTGQADNLRGFEFPATFQDFSDCPTSTPEPDFQWRAVITNGGPARGFSPTMPSFGELLTQEQIGNVIGYLRALCTEPTWPRGNLNLPRPLVTEKAFPENETVVAGSINAQGEAGLGSSVIYEHRIGPSAMLEAIIPFDFTNDTGTWGAGFGDLVLGYKQKLLHSVRKGAIFSVGGELIAPTGNRTLGTGGESTVFETFAAYGQLLPAGGFVQLHSGIELPAHPLAHATAP